MWVVTYREAEDYKPRAITLEALNYVEQCTSNGYEETESQAILAAPTRKACVALYLYHFGFTWAERAKGVECHHVYGGDLNLNAMHTLSSVSI